MKMQRNSDGFAVPRTTPGDAHSLLHRFPSSHRRNDDGEVAAASTIAVTTTRLSSPMTAGALTGDMCRRSLVRTDRATRHRHERLSQAICNSVRWRPATDSENSSACTGELIDAPGNGRLRQAPGAGCCSQMRCDKHQSMTLLRQWRQRLARYRHRWYSTHRAGVLSCPDNRDTA